MGQLLSAAVSVAHDAEFKLITAACLAPRRDAVRRAMLSYFAVFGSWGPGILRPGPSGSEGGDAQGWRRLLTLVGEAFRFAIAAVHESEPQCGGSQFVKEHGSLRRHLGSHRTLARDAAVETDVLA